MKKHLFLLFLFIISINLYANEVIKISVESHGGPTVAIISLEGKNFNSHAGDFLEYDIKINSKNQNAVFLSNHYSEDLINPKATDIFTMPKNFTHVKTSLENLNNENINVIISAIMGTDDILEAVIDNVKITRNEETVYDLYTNGNIQVEYNYPSNKYDNVKLAFVDTCDENEPIRDTLKWLDSMLPANTYIGTHAESWDKENQKWVSNVEVYQLFKSMVYKPWNVAFWRKDAVQNFYGEMFTFDRDKLRLHSETFPPKTPIDPEDQTIWDDRIERARIFVEDRNGKDDYDFSKGRIMATMDGSDRSEFNSYIDTFMVSSFEELNQTPLPRKYQENVKDHVFITREKPFSNIYDGEMEGYEAEEEFKEFDEAFIINQHMNDEIFRERFIFARKGDMYYGVVRWDEAFPVDGKWEISARTVGLRRINQHAPFKFDGFFERVRNEDRIAPPDLSFNVTHRTSINNITDGKYKVPIVMQNTGNKDWKAGDITVKAYLTDKDFNTLEDTHADIYVINTDVKIFDEYPVFFSFPDSWKPGEYYIVVNLESKSFVNKNKPRSFVKKIILI